MGTHHLGGLGQQHPDQARAALIRAWTVLLAIACVGPAAAQQPVAADPVTLQVSLEEAIRRALDVQPAMIQAEGDRRNAGAGQRSALGAFLPSLTANASRSSASGDRFNQATNQIVTGASSISYSAGVSLGLDLFDGFRRFASHRAASAIADAADAGVTTQRFEVTLQTKRVFYDALARAEFLLVADAQVRRAEQQLEISVQKLRAGSATRSDSLRARVDLGNARLTVLQARANLATAQANLGRQIGVDAPVRAAADTALPALPDTAAVRPAFRSAPQVIQAQAQARAAQAQVSVVRARAWPTVSASYSYGYTGFDAPWTNNNDYVNNWSLRFSVSWPLFDGFAREQSMVAAGVSRDLAEARAADVRLQVNAQLTQQLAALETAFSQIDITQENVAAATEDLRVQQERYRVGASTILDLLISQANLTQAQTDLVQARFNYLIARAQVEALVGHAL